ncbi:leucine rich repeat protein [Purpureocillium lavendulum]|uniref:Leucine rich repeat protein n=1 Tax=Purpureocillium lavendulum TaxID=1247861 RepID=A0AB34G6H8_9HYPO|nr:leucine rich repeat protein [Purpureocillium lavendulum]
MSATSHHYDSEKAMMSEASESKAPRVLTRALRSLSSSSMDSIAANSVRSSSSTRRLQKTPSNSGSMIERLHRRVSNHSGGHASPSDAPGSPVEGPQPYSTMEVVHYGPLKADISLLKARAEYLVLSDHCLVKFTTVEAARNAFPQLGQAKSHVKDAAHYSTGKVSSADVRLDIPLRAIVAAFNEDSAHHRSGIEIWWFSQWPRLAYCKAHLHFALPKERDDWLASIHRACRVRLRKNPAGTLIPENLKTRINHIVRSVEGIDGEHHSLVFPVARRVFAQAQRASGTDEAHDHNDSSSFYFVIGPCMCHLVEVLKADYSTLPGDLRVKAVSYGTVTLTRFKASVASHEQRFIMCFRSPFGRETRLDLASVQYRRIIEALIKVDRNLKPMWPQSLQHTIFEVKGLPPPLQLTKGNDLGGLESSLQAYCAAYQVQVPAWKIEWNAPPHPAFRLLPSDGPAYSPLQLLAVFRALRYNSFFKAISFRDVDLSSLAGKNDFSQYGDGIAYRSLSCECPWSDLRVAEFMLTSLLALTISEDHHEILLQATILEQEIHALTFTSESIRSIDLTNTLGLQTSQRLSRFQYDHEALCKKSSELLRPILMLWRQQMSVCQGISMSNNPIAPGDMDELANLLALDYVHIKKLHLAKCALGDAGLSQLWGALGSQGFSLECLDTSDNQGIVRFDAIQRTLKKLQRLTSLNIAGNTRIMSEASLFDSETIMKWALQDLNLSGIMLNDATVDTLAEYLGTYNSHGLQLVRLNNCGLTGRQISRLFRSMGQARRLTIHLNGNRLDEGIDDLCNAIANGYGPWSVFLQMVEFASEANYIKLLRALTVNKTIECLSLAGTATPESASGVACQAVAEFFAKNDTVRFLDFSGYDSKLDEGRLGREFSKALSGIRLNTRIEHLRVRSQMLNFNIGDLAEAISGNKALHTLDCEGNDFNLSNFRHLIKHLDDSTTIQYFSAFSAHELSRAIRKSVETASAAAPIMRRSSVMSRFRSEKVPVGTGKPLVQQLRDEWDAAVADLDRVLQRNQQLLRDKEESDDEAMMPPSGRQGDAENAFSSAFGGLARREFESRRSKGSQGSISPQRRPTSVSANPSSSDLVGQGIARPVSTVSSEAAVSPTTDGASTGGIPSPPELESPSDKDFSLADVQRALAAFGAFGDSRDNNYTYTDAPDADGGLQMKRFRRYWGSATTRIDEEDGGAGDGAEDESP